MNSEQEMKIEEDFAYISSTIKAYQKIIAEESDDAVKAYFRERLAEYQGMYEGAQPVLWALGFDIVCSKDGNKFVIEEIIKN